MMERDLEIISGRELKTMISHHARFIAKHDPAFCANLSRCHVNLDLEFSDDSCVNLMGCYAEGAVFMVSASVSRLVLSGAYISGAVIHLENASTMVDTTGAMSRNFSIKVATPSDEPSM